MSIFLRLAISEPGLDLPVVAAGDIEYFDDVEPLAYDHWVLGGGSDSLVGRLAGRSLSLQAGAPTYLSNYLKMNTQNGSALLTDLADSASAVDTICAVVRVYGSGICIPFGSIGLGGGGPFLAGTSPRKVYSTYTGVTDSFDTGLTMANGNWYFLAASRDFSAATKKQKHFVGGVTGVETETVATYSPATADRRIALGNAYYGSASYPLDFDVAEFVVFRQALTLAELGGVYTRAKARQALRALTVV